MYLKSVLLWMTYVIRGWSARSGDINAEARQANHFFGFIMRMRSSAARIWLTVGQEWLQNDKKSQETTREQTCKRKEFSERLEHRVFPRSVASVPRGVLQAAPCPGQTYDITYANHCNLSNQGNSFSFQANSNK